MDAGQRMVQSGFSKEAFPAGTHICQIFCDEQELRYKIEKLGLSKRGKQKTDL